MSTRSCIGRKTKSGFEAVYHHWDGYPSGVGQTLFQIRKSHFKNDTKKMVNFLLSKPGWSTINKDWDMPVAEMDSDKVEDGGPIYYDASRADQELLTNKNASGSGCEYAYIFEDDKMHILSSVTMINGEKSKMIGMFGMGDENACWDLLATIDLNGDEPDWDEIDELAYSKWED
jgi:hypothetical protein